MSVFSNLFDAAKQSVGNVVDVLGTAANLPEWGISEALASGPTVNTAPSIGPESGLTMDASGNLVYDQSKSELNYTPAIPGVTTKTTPTSTPSSGGGALTSDHLRNAGFNDPNVIESILNSPEETARYLKELGLSSEGDERARLEEQQRRVRTGISDAFAPIYASLDERIGLVGPQREEFMGGVEGLAVPQRQVVETERAKGHRGLESAKVEEQGLAKSAIRDLESDVRNQLKASGEYFGSIGAGDSSATGLASEAIGRTALQERGKIKGGLGKAVNTINLKMQDVNDLATNQLAGIEEWKAGQLQEIKSFFMTRMDSLETAKAGAQASEASAIANMIQDTESAYVERLQKLDDDIFQFRSAISTWQMQRKADLEDYKSKLAMSAGYNVDSTKYTIKSDTFGNIYAVDPENPSDTQQIVKGPLTGLEMTGGGDDEEDGLFSKLLTGAGKALNI